MSKPLSEEQILHQLSRILRSQVFRNSEMLRNFLSYIIREKLKGNQANIKQYNIAVKAFGRSPEFDAAKDPIVRIQAGRLRILLNQYYQVEGEGDSVIFLLPKGRYIPEFKLSGSRDSNFPNHDKWIPNSIGVFPILNLSEEGNLQLLVEGFLEELLIELSRYRHLQVIRGLTESNSATRNSIARFSLTGTFRTGNSIGKITFSLTDNYRNEVLWSLQQKFELGNTDYIKLQEDIANSVAREIAGISGVVSDRLYSESNWENTRHPSAYETYLHFYKYTRDPTPENAQRLLVKVTNAVESEPDFGLGWAVLARLYCDSFVFTLEEQYLPQALTSGLRAIELQPNNQSCHTYCGYAYMINGHYEDAKHHLRRAVELNPNSIHYAGAVGFLLCLMDELEEGRDLIRQCISWDFRYPWWFHIGIFIYHINKHEFEAALNECNKIDTNHYWNSLCKLVANEKMNNLEASVEYLNDLMELNPNFFDRPQDYIGALIQSEQTRVSILESLHQVIDFSESQL